MAKVDLPLGSESASGKIGNMFVFQGNVARAHVVPANVKTPAQVANREFFADMTKMLRAAGPYVRWILRGQLGSRWFTNMTGKIKKDYGGFLTLALAQWAGAGEVDRQPWNTYAPVLDTHWEPGKVFFCIHYFLAKLFEQITPGYLWGFHFSTYGPGPAAENYRSDIHDVLPFGGITFTELFTGCTPYPSGAPEWNLWMLPGNASQWEGVFWGEQLVILFMRGPEFGEAQIFIDGKKVADWFGYDPATLNSYAWKSAVLEKGIHVVRVVPVGLTGLYSLYVEGTLVPSSHGTLSGRAAVIGALDLRQQSDVVTLPDSGYTRIYADKHQGLWAILVDGWKVRLLADNYHPYRGLLRGFEFKSSEGYEVRFSPGEGMLEDGQISVSDSVKYVELDYMESGWVAVYLKPGGVLCDSLVLPVRSESGLLYLPGDPSTRCIGIFWIDWQSEQITVRQVLQQGNEFYYRDFDPALEPYRVLNVGLEVESTQIDIGAVVPSAAEAVYLRIVSTANAVARTATSQDAHLRGEKFFNINLGSVNVQNIYAFHPLVDGKIFYYFVTPPTVGGLSVYVLGYKLRF